MGFDDVDDGRQWVDNGQTMGDYGQTMEIVPMGRMVDYGFDLVDYGKIAPMGRWFL